MNALLDAPLAIVDLETTDMNPAHDRITEIAVVEVQGGEIANEWSTLVNPQATIPAAIQALTGITQAMVADAPPFSRIAGALHERLANRILVAHNARFDYGFLRHEFGRAGVQFAARTLCTVKLSRRLYPEHPHHNLDSVMARHGLACSMRHRALGDAQVVWQFLRTAAEEHGMDAVSCAARQIVRKPAHPAYIDPALVDSIPEAPGVYLFYGEALSPLYIGKSARMRTRVLAHFAEDLRSATAMHLARAVRRIEWQRTAGELGALLREAALLKTHRPVFNRQLRKPVELRGFALELYRWPYRGAIGIVEEDRERDATEVQVVRDWCWLGTARSDAEVAELLEGGVRPRFDLDQHRILARVLRRPGARVVELH